MPDSTADNEGRTPRSHQSRGGKRKLNARVDALMPDLRGDAQAQGRDPEEVDPLTDDEDALRRASSGGGSRLE